MKTNKSFPHPVLGVNKGILPDLTEDALTILSITEKDDLFSYKFELKYENEQIKRYINEGHAIYVCEIDCEKTLYKRNIRSKESIITIDINKHDVKGHVDFSFYIVTLVGMPKYKNLNFNSDYLDPTTGGFPSFNLETGAVLAVFPPYQDNVDLIFNNKPELNAFIQIVKGKTNEKNVLIDINEDIINIELPIDMYADFIIYNRDEYRGIFYTSIIFNALVKGILNISDYDSTTWADSIKAIMDASSKRYAGLSLDNPKDAVDIATLMLSNPAYGTPYDLLFSCIRMIQN